MRRAVATAVAAAAIAAAACAPAPPQFTAADEAAIKAMFDATPKYFVAKTFEPWSDQFGADGWLFPANAPAVKGKAALVEWAKAFPTLEEASFSDVTIHGEGNLAWGTSHYRIKIKDVGVDSGKQLVVFHRGADGKWTIPAGAFNSDIPLPPPPAAPKKK